MTSNRFYKLDTDKQKMIIDTALEEFAAKGFSGSSINKISKKAGLSAGNLYYYFENKEDLYFTIIDIVFKNVQGINEDNTLSFWEAIERSVRQRIEVAKDNRNAGLLLNRLFANGISSNDCEVEKITRDKVQGELKRIFDEGIQQGIIRTDMPLEYLFSVHLGLVLATNRWLIDNLEITDNPEEIDTFIKKAIGMIRTTMSPIGGV